MDWEVLVSSIWGFLALNWFASISTILLILATVAALTCARVSWLIRVTEGGVLAWIALLSTGYANFLFSWLPETYRPVVFWLLIAFLYFSIMALSDIGLKRRGRVENERAVVAWAVMYVYTVLNLGVLKDYFEHPPVRVNYMSVNRWKRPRMRAAYPRSKFDHCEFKISWKPYQGIVGTAFARGQSILARTLNFRTSDSEPFIQPDFPKCPALRKVKMVFTYVVRRKRSHGVLSIDSDEDLIEIMVDKMNKKEPVFVNRVVHDVTKDLMRFVCELLCELFEGDADGVAKLIERGY